MNLLFSGRAMFSRTLVGPGFAKWATRIAGSGSDEGTAITSDSSGNIYIVGNYDSFPVTVYNTPGTDSTIPTLENSAITAIYIVKYNSSGIAQWATCIGGDNNAYVYGITVDSTGNYIYVTGYYFSSTLTFYNTPGTSGTITLENSGFGDVFVAKYNSSGTALWATRIAGTGSDYGSGITVDSTGNYIYVTGSYTSTATVYNTPGTGVTIGTLPNSGSLDAFVVKYHTSGVAQWATRIAGAGLDEGKGITVDSSGNIYVTGTYESTPVVTVYNTPGTGVTIATLPNSGIGDAFVVKYNSSGIAQWATRIAGADTEKGSGIKVDSSGNIYVVGTYGLYPVTVYNTPGTSSTIPTLAGSGTSFVFVVKYNTSGIAQWATRINKGTGLSETGITIDSSGNICVTGSYGFDPLTVYNTPGTTSTIPTLASPVFLDAFVVKYNSSGVAQWATRIDGDYESGTAITSDSSGNIYVTGKYNGSPAIVYNTPGTTSTIPKLENSGATDAFIVKFMSEYN